MNLPPAGWLLWHGLALLWHGLALLWHGLMTVPHCRPQVSTCMSARSGTVWRPCHNTDHFQSRVC